MSDPPPSLLVTLDRLLRGQLTSAEGLRSTGLRLPTRGLLLASLGLGTAYGGMMGLYAVSVRGAPGLWQVLSSAIKVPLLFTCTLVVTFPSLYVFSALARSRFGIRETLNLLLAAIAVNLALLASFGPITAFFTFSTDSYPFMILLNVFFFAISGLVGLRFLRRTLDLVMGHAPGAAPPVATLSAAAPTENTPGGAARAEQLPATGGSEESGAAARVFNVWLVIYGAVGAQLGWLLRPFIGNPEMPQLAFRQREANFFSGLLNTLEKLLQ